MEDTLHVSEAIAALAADVPAQEVGFKYKTVWACQKWSEEACEFVRRRLDLAKFEPISSRQLLAIVGREEELLVVPGNLLLNEGLQRLGDLLIAAGGTSYNNANAFIGVGDSTTAEAATQTDLQAATNKFYKGMNAGKPVRPGSNGNQSIDWASDFTSTEANYVWNEWTISAGATSASGAGFTVGTTNLNRKVASLGTKTTGTWTLTATITFS